MTSFDQAVDKLCNLLAQHDSVLAYQEIESQVKAHPQLRGKVHAMKAYQQDAVLFDKLDKQAAYAQAEQEAQALQDELEGLPLVVAYRDRMQDASDVLLYVTKTLEERINEELTNGK